MESNESKHKLIENIAFLLASGKISPDQALPVLKGLSQGSPSINDARALFKEQKSDEFKDILASLTQIQIKDAVNFYEQNKTGNLDREYFSETLESFSLDLRSDWYQSEKFSKLSEFCTLQRDYFFIRGKLESLPQIFGIVEDKYKSKLTKCLDEVYLWSGICPETLVKFLWDRVDDNYQKELRVFKPEFKGLIDAQNEKALSSLQELPSELIVEDHDSYLYALKNFNPDSEASFIKFSKLAIQWPARDIIPVFKKLWQVETYKERLSILFHMRFGALSSRKMSSWDEFFESEERHEKSSLESLKYLSKNFSSSLLYLWTLRYPGVSKETSKTLENICLLDSEDIKPEEFVERWSEQLRKEEKNLLLGVEETIKEKEPVKLKLSKKVSLLDVSQEVDSKKEDVNIPERISEEPTESFEEPTIEDLPKVVKPSVWNEHMKPFLTENWFMMAGVILFVVGSGIVSYVTWDKHWLFRYTLMPALLAFFTAGLAYLGRWISEKDESFKTTATILRGAAIQLLPINFMAVALLSSDNSVSMKNVFVPAMSALYLGCSWFGLKKLSRAVYEPLENTLSRTVLLINSLVILVPLVSTFGYENKQALLLILGVGFYFGFAILAQSTLHFCKNILTKKLASEKQVIWFYGLALIGTYLQVFGWVHSQIRHLPQVHTYAPMLILCAALLLMVERKAASLLDNADSPNTESFIGYGMVILGVLMGAGHEYVRVVSCLLAGLVWYFQASQHRSKLHYYISLTFFMAAIFSCGFIGGFPISYLPALGIFSVVLLSVGVKLSRSHKTYELARACKDTQLAALLITVLSAMLVQLQFKTPPYLTAVYLLFSACMFIRRSYLDDQLRWLHSAMFIFALTLPYLGCVDLVEGTLEGNTLIFGIAVLSILWILAVHFIPFRLLKDARSSVLWFYGILSMSAMVIRVVMERGAPLNPQWYLAFMDYTGPIVMAIILVLTTYYSRSLVPAFMASVIAIILFPELKANFRATFEMVGFGSGLGSAVTASSIILLSFFLRRNPKLENLSSGDKFLNKYDFPFRRYDHTLFTWPLMISACFLLIKTGTLNFVRQILNDGVSIKGAIALVLVGLSSWMLCIYYRRKKGHLCFHPAWVYLLLGLILLFERNSTSLHLAWPVLLTLLAIQTLHFASISLKDKYPWLESLFERRAAATLSVLSHIVSFICILVVIFEGDKKPLLLLMLFLVSQFIWHALTRKNFSFAVHLYLLILVNLIGWPLETLTDLFTPVILFAGLVLTAHVFVERNKTVYLKWRPLLKPFLVMATLSVLGFALRCVPFEILHSELSHSQSLIIAGLLLVAGRAHLSRFLVLWAALISFSVFHNHNIQEMLNPLHIALLGLSLVLINEICSILASFKPRIVSGSNGIIFLRSISEYWLYCPAVFAIISAECFHLTHEWRGSGIQVLSSYTSAVTLIMISRKWRHSLVYAGAILFLTLGNIHLLRVTCGEILLSGGLSENHIVCLGLGISLLLLALARKISDNKSLNTQLGRSGLVMSFLILFILVGNYLVHPNLKTISLLRFGVSGLMSLMAALYFRYAARHPEQDDEKMIVLCEGIYHFGISMAFWCLSLMIPFLRTPQTAMLAFGIPAIYLFIRAELGFRGHSKEFNTYRNSSVVIFYILLCLYLGRSLVHMIFYPDNPMDSNYYHMNAPLILLYGVLLCRAHALGAKLQTAFVGGLAIVTGVFFTVTALPSLSPFNYPVRACWVAVLSGHFWILVNHKKSPLRTLLQQVSSLSDQQWQSLRFPWGNSLLLAVHLIFIIGLTECGSNTLLVAPLILGVATVTLHLCIIRKSPLLGLIFILEFLVGLHAGFFVESYLSAEMVIWVLLAIWGILLFVHLYVKEKVGTGPFSKAACFCAVLISIHIAYHQPHSTVGLAAVVLMAILALATPCVMKEKSFDERLFGILYLILPSYLSYFSAYDGGQSFVSYIAPLPVTCFALFLSGIAVHLFKKHIIADELKLFEERYIFYLTKWLLKEETIIYSCILYLSSGLTLFTFYCFNDQAFSPRDFGLLLISCSGLSIAWYFFGEKKKDMFSYILMIISGLMCFALLRHQLVLTTDIWKNEYDVLSSLLFSLIIATSKSWLDRCERNMQIPVLTLLFLLPAAALAWSSYNSMGTDYTLTIIGMNSLIFTFLGKDSKTSSYNFIAVGGFVAFFVIALWSKLEIHSMHAYVLPTGIGVLILLQLFHDKVSLELRNRIRLITLVTMMATVAYYALISEPRSIAFNITMLTVSLIAMSCGGFLKIRLYLIFGFAGLIANLVSIMTHLVIGMDKGARMAVLGCLILLIGSALVFGNLYYKTHQEGIRSFIDKWRKRFGVWE